MTCRHTRLPVLSAFILFLIFCSGTVSGGGPTGAVEGTVHDSRTGGAVAGAKVSLNVGLNTKSTITDTLGVFVLNDIPAATALPITISHPAYKDTLSSVTVEAGMTIKISIAIDSTYLRLTYPNGGEKIFAGSELHIAWISAGIKTVRLEFSFNSGRTWQVIIPETDATTGHYRWEVPDIPSSGYLIRITDTDDVRLHDVSDGTFSNSST